MTATVPVELGQLLRASTNSGREAAWEDLIAQHTRLILAVAWSFGGDSDQAMDRYAFILEKLRESDFARIRTFRPNAGARFSTWLTVTARRLCVDYHRSRYGRLRDSSGSEESVLLYNLRRNLARAEGGDDNALANIPDPHESGENQPVVAQRDAILRDELKKLSPPDRLLIALRFEDGLSAARIASAVGVPSQFTVYNQLNSILSRLRSALESRGIENAEG